jgi:Ni/Fe-hydrogenase subunit HybB-like protein
MIISGYNVASYSASIYEFMLGFGGMAITAIATIFAIKVFPLLPESLSDKVLEK